MDPRAARRQQEQLRRLAAITHPTSTDEPTILAAIAGPGGATPLVIRPRDTDETARAVGAADTLQLPLHIQGGNATDHHGATPRGEPTLVTRWMAELELDDAHGTLTVGAGVTLDDIHEHLNGTRWELPVDHPDSGRHTIGGLISIDADGTHTLRWRHLIDHVAHLEVVTGTGTIVAQHDPTPTQANWTHLVAGAEGTLGVITSVTLRLQPRGTHSTVHLSFSDLRDAIDTAAAAPAAFPNATRCTLRVTTTEAPTHIPGDTDTAGDAIDTWPATVTIEVAGTPPDVAAIAAAATGRTVERSSVTPTVTRDELRPNATSYDIPTASLAGFIAAVVAIGGQVHVDTATGTVIVDADDTLTAMIDQVAEHHRGSPTTGGGYGRDRRHLIDRRGPHQVAADAMRTAIDPNRTLNPGL